MFISLDLNVGSLSSISRCRQSCMTSANTHCQVMSPRSHRYTKRSRLFEYRRQRQQRPCVPAPRHPTCSICTDPAWFGDVGIRILGGKSNQAVEVIRDAKSVRDLAKKSDKERLTRRSCAKGWSLLRKKEEKEEREWCLRR